MHMSTDVNAAADDAAAGAAAARDLDSLYAALWETNELVKALLQATRCLFGPTCRCRCPSLSASQRTGSRLTKPPFCHNGQFVLKRKPLAVTLTGRSRLPILNIPFVPPPPQAPGGGAIQVTPPDRLVVPHSQRFRLAGT